MIGVKIMNSIRNFFGFPKKGKQEIAPYSHSKHGDIVLFEIPAMAGQMGEGNPRAGLKHSIVMLVISYVVLTYFLQGVG